ncbi:MAG: peptide ABC transporter substrate-binding protein [Candidatus Synoicihabitans palmerolidicus]|nr:peptide ABC transporter substrate-binding protein [Candidatus Synoicihabitans palmerolidicus]
MCQRRETPVDQGNATQTMHVASVGEPSELDPHIINAPPNFKIVDMLFEGIVTAHPATLEPQPGVAASWDISADRRTYTFYLRPDARWSNGDPVTAADFLYSWQRALTPALGSQYTFLFSTVVGAADFTAGRTTDFSAVGFSAPDERPVTITLDQPTPSFLSILANNPVWSPVHRATIEHHGSMTDRNNGWTKPETFVGNGPFVLTAWDPNVSIRVERSATYWDSSHIALHALVYHAYDDAETQERAFRAGQLHRTALVPVSKLPVYRAQTSSPLHEVESLIATFININTSRPPFDDARVRRAFALAIDRDILASRVFFDVATPARRIVPTGMPGYPLHETFTDDSHEAQTLLAASGYPAGQGFPTVELAVPSGGSTELPEVVQACWRDILRCECRNQPQ